MKKEFSKAYEPKKYEGQIYQQWEKSGFFNPDNLEVDENAENYSIVMPPPNVTGTLHLGHAEMLAIEDILIRYHRMKGWRTLWTPGTDHAAIATQTKVEKLLKEKGQNRHSLGRENFLRKVEDFAQISHDTIVNQVRKMGCSCDWSREAYTLDETRHRAVYSVFKMMYDDGLIYQGERIVNWCPRCHSTLADDEVEYREEKAKLYWIKYGPFVLATARPETKLGDTAVAVHPDDARYKAMVGKEYDIPGVLGDFKIKVVADRAVDPEFGSGAIKVTPAHSFVDNEIAQRHNLPWRKIIDEDGRMMENCGKYAGLTTTEAREAIVADMEKIGLIDRIEDDYRHSISTCYRCEAPIEPIPSEQWFIDVNRPVKRKSKFANREKNINWEGKSIKEMCVEVVKSGKVKITPRRFEKNYFHWMENLRDWCISRQLWYGHRIPVWYPEPEQSSVRGKLKSGKDQDREIYVGVEPPRENGWLQDEDTLDTWFSSGLWTFSTLASKPEQIKFKNGQLAIDSEDFKRFHPTNVLETGYDILFFWVARMIIMTTYAIGDVPFRDVYLHGLVLDEKGKKMSKSKGNVIDPLDMCNEYGTDAVRLSLIIGSTPGKDLRLSEEKIASFRNLVNKLWNVARFITDKTKNENDSKKASSRMLAVKSQASKIDPAKLTLADAWILGKMQKLIGEITDDIKSYRFSTAGEKLRDFTWNGLADWYLEISKFEENKKTKAVILKKILKDLLKLWHPFIPFVTEKIWQNLEEEKLLMIEKWPEAEKYLQFVGVSGGVNQERFEKIKKIIISIRNARTQYHIEPKEKIAIILGVGKEKVWFESQVELIKSLRTGVAEVELREKIEKVSRAYFDPVKGLELVIPLEGLIDLKKERKRLETDLQETEKRIKLIESKLKNESFLKNAPSEVVSREKKKLEIQQKQSQMIARYLKNLE